MGLLNTIEDEREELEIKRFTSGSLKFFKKKRKELGKVTPKRLIASHQNLVTRKFVPGKMYTFAYDPALKQKMDGWDTFPLIIVLDKNKSNILGMNLHYLSINKRSALLNKLAKFTTKQKFDFFNKIKLKYDFLSKSRKFIEIFPTLPFPIFNTALKVLSRASLAEVEILSLRVSSHSMAPGWSLNGLILQVSGVE